MARLMKLQWNRDYATEANAIKAVEKRFPEAANDGLTYFLMRTPEGRFFPVFVGERALQAQVHFHFNVVA